MTGSGILIHAARHGMHVRWHVWVSIDGHRLAEVRRAWGRRRAAVTAQAWRAELMRATNDELLNMLKVGRA